jgi:hypothetical protein
VTLLPFLRPTAARCIAGLILVKSFLFVMLLPPWQGPDEAARLEPAVVVAHNGIASSGMKPDMEFQKSAVASMRVFRAWDFYERKIPAPDVQDFNSANLPAGASFLYEPSFSYLPAALLIRLLEPNSALTALYTARLASLILHLISTLLVAAIGLLAFRGAYAAPLRAALVLIYGLHPQISFLAAAVHPDNLGLLMGTLVLVLLLLVAKYAETPGLSMKWIGPLTVLLALAALAGQIIRKLIILAPFLLVSIPVIFWPRIRKAGILEGLARIAWAVLVVGFLLAVALYLNPEAAGSRLHWTPLIARADEIKQTGVLGGWIRYAGILYTTFWMALGSLVHKLSPTWLVLLSGGLAWGAWGWVTCSTRRGVLKREPLPGSRLPLILLGLWLGMVFLSILAAYGNPASNVEGRYLLLALPSVIVLWLVGLGHTRRHESACDPVLLWTTVLMLLSFAAIFEYLIPIYYLTG